MKGLWSRAPLAHGLCSSCCRKLFRRIGRNRDATTSPAQSVHTHAGSRRPRLSSARMIKRKQLGAPEVFTALYATVMASAAVAGVDSKDRRQLDLDHRLIEAQQDLWRVLRDSAAEGYSLAMELPMGPNPPKNTTLSHKTTSSSPPAIASPFRVVGGLSAICIPPEQLRRNGAVRLRNEAYLTWLHAQYGLSRRWWSQRPPPRGGLPVLEEAIVAEQERHLQWTFQDKDFGQREPRSPLQFTRMVESAEQLVNNLMIEANRLGYPNDPEGARRATESLSSPWHNIRLLRSEGYPDYRLPDLDPKGAAEARFAASAAARRIFDDWRATRRAVYAEDGAPPPTAEGVSDPAEAAALARHWYSRRIKHWVGKLCHNLLVCTAPPGIHMYNMLLQGFASIKCPSLGNIVVDSLLYNTHLQPTQQTFVCLLYHYRAQGDLVGFYGILRRLVGLDPRGAKIRRRAAVDVAEAAMRSRGRNGTDDYHHDIHYHQNKLRSKQLFSEIHKWAHTRDVALADDYVVQRAAIDAALLDAILTGLLSLGQVRHAAFVFSAFMADCGRRLEATSFPGWPLSSPGPAAFPVTTFADGDMVIGVDAGRLNRFLNCVLDAVDIPAARALLRGFSENVGLITPLLLSDERYGRKLAIKIHLLLSVAATPEPLQIGWDADENEKHVRKDVHETASGPNVPGLALEVPRPRGPVSVNRAGQVIKPRDRTGSRLAATNSVAIAVTTPASSVVDNSVLRLTSALFVADTQQYLRRLSQIVAAAQRALLAGEESPSAYPTARPLSISITPWTVQLENLNERPHRRGREKQLYRRMARLKVMDETVARLIQTVAQLREVVLETVVEGVGGIRQGDDLNEARMDEYSAETDDDGAPVVYTTESFDEAADAEAGQFDDGELQPEYVHEEEPWNPDSALLPYAYRDFLLRTSVPFAVRFASYLDVVAPRVLAAGGGAPIVTPITEPAEPPDASAVAAAVDEPPAPLPSHLLHVLERQVMADMLAVGADLEEKLRRILAQSYLEQQQQQPKIQPETEPTAVSSASDTAPAKASADLSLDTLLATWARQKRQREEVLEQQRKATRPLGLVARYREGLRVALPGW